VKVEPSVTWPAAFWTSYSLDPATGEVFAPVANPFPDFAAAKRSGDNLYTNSVISLDAVTGKLNWFNQLIAGDDHDWDVGTPPTLYRTLSGKSLLAIAGKSGIVTGIDRASKTVIFKTPGTTISNTERVDETLKLVCPGASGGVERRAAPCPTSSQTGRQCRAFVQLDVLHGARSRGCLRSTVGAQTPTG
jgi:alcohol dehydrogenase (cytochrome c)